MVAGPIVGEAIGGPEDSCLCADDVMLGIANLWWTSLRCSLSQSMVGEMQEKTGQWGYRIYFSKTCTIPTFVG